MMKSVDDLADDWAICRRSIANFTKSASKNVTSAHFFAVQLAFTVRTLTHRHPLGDIVARFANERRAMRRA
jgi:hypothetical protein